MDEIKKTWGAIKEGISELITNRMDNGESFELIQFKD